MKRVGVHEQWGAAHLSGGPSLILLSVHEPGEALLQHMPSPTGERSGGLLVVEWVRRGKDETVAGANAILAS
jgi:hypothetical protein